jgi:hypothetical protein
MQLWIVGLLLLLVAVTAPVHAAESSRPDDLVVRAEVRPEEAWVGQQVVLQVDVLAAGGWAQLAGNPRIELPAAYVMPRQGQGIRLQETIDGQPYSGQRYEFFVYPQRADRLVLQDTPINVRVRQLGLDADEVTLSATLPGLTIDSRLPPGAGDLQGLISTTAFSADQRWEPANDRIQVGDAVRRTVLIEAADVSGMAITPLAHERIDGIGLYPAEPRVDDRYHRGSLAGSRTEIMTYVAERAGRFELPSINLIWWDTANGQLRRVELPGMTLTVSDGAAEESAATAAALLASPWLIALLALLVSLFALHKPIGRLWLAVVRSRARSEPHQFRVLLAAVRRGRPALVRRELMRWLDRTGGSARPARLDWFLDRYGDPQTRAAITPLLEGLGEGGGIADRRLLLDGLIQARRRWLRHNHRAKAGLCALPPLNGAHSKV